MAPLPVKPRDIPNLITGLRILLVAPFLWLLLKEHYGAALVLFAVAGVSDALDGFLAKYYGWTSELGGILDPIADKLLLLGAILALGWLHELPGWLVMLVLVRDALIVGGAISYHLMIARFQAAPLMISKAEYLAAIDAGAGGRRQPRDHAATNVAAGNPDRPDRADHRLERHGLRLALGPRRLAPAPPSPDRPPPSS